MLVDDHELVRTSLAAMLTPDEGLDIVAQFGSAGDAISYLSEQQPDIALVDLMLGKGSGLDVVRHIEENHLPTEVLMITGMTSPVLINLPK